MAQQILKKLRGPFQRNEMLVRQITRPRLDPTPVLRRLRHAGGKLPFTGLAAPGTYLDLRPVRRNLDPDRRDIKT